VRIIQRAGTSIRTVEPVAVRRLLVAWSRSGHRLGHIGRDAVTVAQQLERRELQIDAPELRVVQSLQSLLSTPHVLPGPHRRKVGTALEQLVDECL